MDFEIKTGVRQGCILSPGFLLIGHAKKINKRVTSSMKV